VEVGGSVVEVLRGTNAHKYIGNFCNGKFEGEIGNWTWASFAGGLGQISQAFTFTFTGIRKVWTLQPTCKTLELNAKSLNPGSQEAM
jgi:hypothetical protein